MRPRSESGASMSIADQLLGSEEASVRLKVLTGALGKTTRSPRVRSALKDMAASRRVMALLAGVWKDKRTQRHPYSKWAGSHWVLADLADMGYPAGDDALLPLRDSVYEWLLSKSHRKGIKTIDGRVRRCASQEGNALFSTLRLGIADSRSDELASRLMEWQWPDGGWNCDKNPAAGVSSFHETLLPMRGLALYARTTGSRKARSAVRKAAEVFLARRMFRGRRNGKVISYDFTRLHYPGYWHYDILSGLKVMAEAGLIKDRRCSEALDLIESKRLPGGGFPAEEKYYKAKPGKGSLRSAVDWGGAGKRRMNEFVTADVLTVLTAAGREV